MLDAMYCGADAAAAAHSSLSAVLGASGLRVRCCQPQSQSPRSSSQEPHAILRRHVASPSDSSSPSDSPDAEGVVYFRLYAHKTINLQSGEELLLGVASEDGRFRGRVVVFEGRTNPTVLPESESASEDSDATQVEEDGGADVDGEGEADEEMAAHGSKKGDDVVVGGGETTPTPVATSSVGVQAEPLYSSSAAQAGEDHIVSESCQTTDAHTLPPPPPPPSYASSDVQTDPIAPREESLPPSTALSIPLSSISKDASASSPKTVADEPMEDAEEAEMIRIASVALMALSAPHDRSSPRNPPPSSHPSPAHPESDNETDVDSEEEDEDDEDRLSPPPPDLPSAMPSGNGDASEGVKAECSNCGATHTPLWRRGLNDELNCNACGLYCKLHKRPRPKTVRTNSASASEPRSQAAARAEPVNVMAQCYNCHTTVTPLWRKGDEGKPLCNACGLYYKLHGAARPISMKSDVIRKRSRNDPRRGANSSSSANGGVSASASSSSVSEGPSRRASPTGFALPSSASTAAASLSYPGAGYGNGNGNKLKHKYTPSYAERASKRRRIDATSAAQGIVVG